MNWKLDNSLPVDIGDLGESVAGPVRFIDETVTHELGSDLTSEPIATSVRVPPSRGTTIVTFKSQVASTAAATMRSAPYVATVRRRRATAIREELEALGRHATRQDFEVFVHAFVEHIRKAIRDLGDAATEGNSREILRLVRDSLLDGGWENYRTSETRKAAGKLLELVASAEEVAPGDAHKAFDVLDQLGLVPLPPMFSDVEEEIAELPD